MMLTRNVFSFSKRKRNQLLQDYDIEIGAGLGGLAGKVWRIGLMGHSATEENVDTCINALTNIIS